MKGFKILTLAAALCAAVPMTDSAAKPRKPSWGDECKARKTEKERKTCCADKMIDCSLGCTDPNCNGLPSCQTPQIECRRKCVSRGRKCKSEVASLSSPYATTKPQYPVAQPARGRICCKRGGRSWLTTAGNCRAQRGRKVDVRFCRNRDSRTHSTPRRVCCKTRRDHALLSSARCRARRGTPVHMKFCLKTSGPKYRRQRRPQ